MQSLRKHVFVITMPCQGHLWGPAANQLQLNPGHWTLEGGSNEASHLLTNLLATSSAVPFRKNRRQEEQREGDEQEDEHVVQHVSTYFACCIAGPTKASTLHQPPRR